MQILEYSQQNDCEHWLQKIGESDWNAGKFLYKLLDSNRFSELLGEKTKLFLLTEGDALLSFCTFAEKDDIPNTDLTPWIGFAYTFPEYRGNRFLGKLISHALRIAKGEGYSFVYISTNEIGLYEKYGFEFYGIYQDSSNLPSRVYRIKL